MIEPGFQPYPEPAPWHGADVHVQVQMEMFAMPLDYMIEWTNTGHARIVLTGHCSNLEPFVMAIRDLMERDPDDH